MLYVVGGIDPSACKGVKTCERYDILSEKWSEIPGQFDNFAYGASLITAQHRYLIAFGGRDDKGRYSSKPLIRRFDHLNPISGWGVIRVDSATPCRGFYGLMHLKDAETPSILVFGGLNRGRQEDVMTYTGPLNEKTGNLTKEKCLL